ncbi:hypothetical protein D3C86_1638480 [compost metagenome]
MFTTSKLLHCKTTDTMFLPMSCTSPLTVAMTILPLARTSPPAAAIWRFSSSMKGIKWATACFMTRADFTTCGRNILPSPNRSPTTFMPSISGPSMTSMGRPPRSKIFWRTSSVSSTMNVVMPCTSACDRRCSTSALRQVRSSSRLAPEPFTLSANCTRRSVGVRSSSGSVLPTGLGRSSTTSSTRSRSFGSRSAYTPN